MKDTEEEPEIAPRDVARPAVAPDRKKWSMTIKLLSAVVAVVGAVTGVVSVVQVLTRDTSSANTLSVTSTVADTGAAEFALPLSEIDSDFPASAAPCGREQLDWLNKRAIPLERRLRITMRNNASEGAMLALVDFRANVEMKTSPSATHILVVCPTDAPTTAARAASLQVDDAKATARFRVLRSSQQTQAVPDVPVTWNLAPGETGVIDIELAAERGTTGTLVATMLAGRSESVVPIQGSAFELPGMWRHGLSYFTIGTTGFECVEDAANETLPCNDTDRSELEQLRAALYIAG